MTDTRKNPGKAVLLLTYDPLSGCDADPEAKTRQILIDAVVASVYDDGQCPPFLIEDLVANEDDIYSGEVDWFLPVSLSLFKAELNDYAVREYEGLGDEDEITDEMRLNHGLLVIQNLLDDGLEGDQPAASAITIVDYRGRPCLIAYELKGYSFSGVDCDTVGAFRDEQKLHLWYRQNGYMISQDDLEGARAKILANWDYDDTHSAYGSDPFALQENVIDLNLRRMQRTAWDFICKHYPDRVGLDSASRETPQGFANEEKPHE